ncbi:MAG: hypothetical protein DWQ02_05050 [Bacteroidetes bacterium]|nr:MAG: hypothetical protein DWQ02_05050 [Bacteroidota bacterium]
MLKRSIFLFALVFGLFACNNEAPDANAEATDEASTEIPTIKVEDFTTVAADYVGQKIQIAGTVDHTCKHSGKRMVIVGENPDFSVKIEAGEVDQFNRELEGSDVSVIALVTEMRMDNNYLDEWEQEILKNHADDADGGAGELTKIENYRIELKESEKDYLSFYGLDCVSYEVVTAAPISETTEEESGDTEM